MRPQSAEHAHAGNSTGLVRCTAPKQVLKAARGHPFGTREMALPGAPSALRLIIWIDVQNNTRDLSPVGAITLGIQQTQVRNEMLLIVPCQDGFCRSQIGNRRIERRLFHIAPWMARSLHFASVEEGGQDRAFACTAARPHAAACCHC
jgi:hypothetical protein